MQYKTDCKECVFASKPGQCDLGRLENFQTNGATIKYDGDGNATVDGRFCSAYRKPVWTKGKDKLNLPVIVRAELLISTEVLIYINETNYNENMLIQTLGSLKSQLLKPNLTVFIVNRDTNIAKLLKLANSYGLPFRLDRVIKGEEGRPHDLDAMDLSTKRLVADYYVILKPGDMLEDEDFFANIDEALNEKLIRFSVILPTDNRGPVISTALHKKLDGNYPVTTSFIDSEGGDKDTMLNSLEEKISYLARKDKQEFLLKTYQEILV